MGEGERDSNFTNVKHAYTMPAVECYTVMTCSMPDHASTPLYDEEERCGPVSVPLCSPTEDDDNHDDDPPPDGVCILCAAAM